MGNFEECLVQDRRFLHCLPTLKILYSIIALRKRMVDSIEEIPEWVKGDVLSNPINQRNCNGLSDQEIMMMSTEEINKLLKKMGVDKDRQKELRQERRRLTWLSRLRRLWMKFLFIF